MMISVGGAGGVKGMVKGWCGWGTSASERWSWR